MKFKEGDVVKVVRKYDGNPTCPWMDEMDQDVSCMFEIADCAENIGSYCYTGDNLSGLYLPEESLELVNQQNQYIIY